MRVALALIALLAASASAGAARPPVALIASPARLTLAGSATGTVSVTNSGTEPVVVDTARAGYAFDLRGRPRAVAPRSPWLAVLPRRLTLAPGASAPVTVRSTAPRGAEPGEHSELVLLTTRPRAGGSVGVRMRLGVVVVVRVPGRVQRRFDVLRVRARPRRLELLVANRGNVTEAVRRACWLITVRRAGRVLARLRPAERQLLPRTSGFVDVPAARTPFIRVSIVVRFAPGPPCLGARARVFALRR